MADHVGVYAISASFLPSPATVPSKDVTPNSILVNRIVKTELGPGGSTVVTEVIPASATLVSLGNETTVLNAMQSGSEVIETGSYGETTIPLYYSYRYNKSSSSARRTAARRLFTPSLA